MKMPSLLSAAVAFLALNFLVNASPVSNATTLKLVSSLPVAVLGRFGNGNVTAFAAAFPSGNATCDLTFYAGTHDSVLAGGQETGFAVLNGSCKAWGPLNAAKFPHGRVQGNTVSFALTWALTTAACGLQFQIGMAYGVLGGQAVSLASGGATPVGPLCAYYSRISALPSKMATINLGLYEGVTNADGSAVACPSVRPAQSKSILSIGPLSCTGTAQQPLNCVNSPASRCQNYNMGTSDIGIGMSVGGIGLLLVTLFLILVVQRITSQEK